jgi:transcriptional regulator with XRE-family HTH domain
MANSLQTPSQNAERLASFRRQMADFARGERLRQLREGRHLSQEDAAHEIGVSAKTLRSWEHGGGIRWRNVEVLGEFYGVDPNELIEREGTEQTAASLAAIHEQLDRMEEQIAELSRRLSPESENDGNDDLEDAEQAASEAEPDEHARRTRRSA